MTRFHVTIEVVIDNEYLSGYVTDVQGAKSLVDNEIASIPTFRVAHISAWECPEPDEDE